MRKYPEMKNVSQQVKNISIVVVLCNFLNQKYNSCNIIKTPIISSFLNLNKISLTDTKKLSFTIQSAFLRKYREGSLFSNI